VRGSLPAVLFQPASQSPPIVAHGGAIWVIVLRKGQGGACLRLTGARMGTS
jgi:Fe-S cluster biogenesis protein NfuA